MREIWVPTIDAFYRRGLLNDIVPLPHAVSHTLLGTSERKHEQPRGPEGHFAGIPFDFVNVDSAKWSYRLNTEAITNIATDIAHIESVLELRANTLGVVIKRGCAVEDFTQSDDAVTVRAGSETFHSRWLVGCDGGRSVVRKRGGFEFVGTAPEFTSYWVQVEMSDLHKIVQGRHYTSTGKYFQSGPGTIRMVEFDGDMFHRSQPVTLEHVQTVLRRITGTLEVSVKAHFPHHVGRNMMPR